MISISSTLGDAAGGASRSPLLSVGVERVDHQMTVIPGLSVPYAIHRLAQGNGYFLATGYDITNCTNIYYKRMTSVDAAADWNSGYTLLAGAVGSGIAYRHDLYVNGSDVVVCYCRSGVFYIKESADGGASFSEQAAVTSHGGENNVIGCAILDPNTIYFVTSGNVMFRATRSGGVWTDGDDWPHSNFWTFISVGSKTSRNQMHARMMENGDHLIVFNARKGDTEEFESATMIAVAIYRTSYGWVRPALGHLTIDFDYWHLLAGMGAKMNGYFFAGILERYIEKADSGMATPKEAYELCVARSKDLLGWHLIPTDIYVSSGAGYSADVAECYIAGFVVDGSNVCVVISRPTIVSNVYLCPASSWWGEDPVEEVIVPLGDISISRSTETAAQTEFTLSNKDGAYTDHNTVKAGSIVRIEAGYRTPAGDESQRRFTGSIVNKSRPGGIDKLATFTVMDMLWRATAIKQAWPQTILGQNVFFVDFADPLNVDHFVAQNGQWRESGGMYEQFEQGENAISLCGYDPSAAHITAIKMRFVNDIADHRAGIVIHQSVSDSGVTTAFVCYYDKTAGKIRIASIDTEEMADPVVLASSASDFVWSADTDYWLLARIVYGYIQVWYSIDGVNYVLAVSSTATSGQLGPHGYTGLYAYIDNADETTALIRFDNVEVFSAETYLSGSTVMEYLAAIAGIDTDEQGEIIDLFSGSSFGSRWGADIGGTWSVSGGYALGVNGITVPAVKLLDVSVSDVVVKCSLNVKTQDSGVVVRSTLSGANCYSGSVSTTAVKIRKASNGSWSTLRSIPGTYSGNVELVMVARGKYLSVYVDGALRCTSADSSYEDGYFGLYSDAVAGNPSQHDYYYVDGWYKPVDGVTIRPKDTVGSIMSQLASMYTDGHFFCNEDGELVYGVFDSEDVALDVRSLILDYSYARNTDKVLTSVRAVGANAYGEVRDRPWSIALLGNRYENIQVSAAPTGNACYDLAVNEMEVSQRITEESVRIKGHPAIELCDVIGTAEPGAAAQARQVLSFSESFGPTNYEMSFDGLQSVVGESP